MFIFCSDGFRDPPDYWKNYAFDLAAELDSIHPSEFQNGLDFYNALLKILRKTKDSHAMLVPPFLQYFAYVFPYKFIARPSFSNPEIPMFEIVENTFTQRYINNYNGQNITGKNYIIDMCFMLCYVLFIGYVTYMDLTGYV